MKYLFTSNQHLEKQDVTGLEKGTVSMLTEDGERSGPSFFDPYSVGIYLKRNYDYSFTLLLGSLIISTEFQTDPLLSIPGKRKSQQQNKFEMGKDFYFP